MAGDLTLQSSPGDGSAFTFRFEATRVPDDLVETSTGFLAATHEPAKRPSIPSLQACVQDIPAALSGRLRDAAQQARAVRLIQLAEIVAEHSQPAAVAIRALTHDFRYADLLRALEGKV
jgi:hypothetical protein